jgi:hypothetical protein
MTAIGHWTAAPGKTNPLRGGVIGGLIGSVAGIAMCTLISNAFFNEGTGFSTCTTKGNVLFGAGGFAVGFTIGWLRASRKPRA